MVRLIKVRIHFGIFWVILDNINAKIIVKIKLAHVRGINVVLFNEPKPDHLGVIK